MRGAPDAPNASASAPPLPAVDDCLVCSRPHLASTLALIKSPCGCDVLMCPACQRAPMTVEWIKHYACACRPSAQDLSRLLSA